MCVCIRVDQPSPCRAAVSVTKIQPVRRHPAKAMFTHGPPAGDDDLMSSASSGSVVAQVQMPSRASGLFGFFSKTLGTIVARITRTRGRSREDGAATDWDLNEDSRLDRNELKAMARADVTRYDRYMAADLGGDGVLESGELRVAEEAEDQHTARAKTLAKDAHKRNVRKVSSYWTSNLLLPGDLPGLFAQAGGRRRRLRHGIHGHQRWCLQTQTNDQRVTRQVRGVRMAQGHVRADKGGPQVRQRRVSRWSSQGSGE